MGINGINTLLIMSKNCGMEGMHGNESKKTEKPHENQIEIIKKISDGLRGKKIDLSI